MSKRIAAQIVYYGIYGLLSVCITVLMLPQAFAGSAVSLVVYGLLMAASMYACNRLELKVWQRATTAQANNMGFRMLVRLGIYLLVPAVAVWVVGLTGLLTLSAGFWTAMALVWMPLMLGAWLNYFPARSRS